MILKKFLSIVLFIMFSVQCFCLESGVFSVTDVQLQNMSEQVQLIRQELSVLKMNLMMSETESVQLRDQLSLLEKRLMMVQKKLATASQSLEKSEADLIELQIEIETVTKALDELKERVKILNFQLAKLKKQNKILIGVTITLSCVIVGVGLYAGLKR